MARKKFNIQAKVTKAAALGAGAVAANKLADLVPVENSKIQAAAPIVLGLFLADKKGFMGDLGAGMIASGASQMASEFGIGYVPSRIMGTVDLDIEPDAMSGHAGQEMNF